MRRYVLVSLVSLALLRASVFHAAPVLTTKTLDAWKTYVDLTRQRINEELKVLPPRLRSDAAALVKGKIHIEPLKTRNAQKKEINIPDGAVHHWLAAIYIPGATVDKVASFVQNYPQYKDYFNDVERSEIRSHTGDTFDIFLRLKRSKLGYTAHFNTKHHVAYGPRSPGFLASLSESTEIREVKDAGAATEKEYPLGNDSGYLWRLNSYWRFTGHDGGVIVECESIGLSRDLGLGLSFLNVLTFGTVKNIADSIAREALEQTLTDLREGVRGGPKKPAE